ncbi:hypothetical protein RCL1_005992 [Eukaryota sp. TZLM3-RCL]
MISNPLTQLDELVQYLSASYFSGVFNFLEPFLEDSESHSILLFCSTCKANQLFIQNNLYNYVRSTHAFPIIVPSDLPRFEPSVLFCRAIQPLLPSTVDPCTLPSTALIEVSKMLNISKVVFIFQQSNLIDPECFNFTLGSISSLFLSISNTSLSTGFSEVFNFPDISDLFNQILIYFFSFCDQLFPSFENIFLLSSLSNISLLVSYLRRLILGTQLHPLFRTLEPLDRPTEISSIIFDSPAFSAFVNHILTHNIEPLASVFAVSAHEPSMLCHTFTHIFKSYTSYRSNFFISSVLVFEIYKLFGLKMFKFWSIIFDANISTSFVKKFNNFERHSIENLNSHLCSVLALISYNYSLEIPSKLHFLVENLSDSNESVFLLVQELILIISKYLKHPFYELLSCCDELEPCLQCFS